MQLFWGPCYSLVYLHVNFQQMPAHKSRSKGKLTEIWHLILGMCLVLSIAPMAGGPKHQIGRDVTNWTNRAENIHNNTSPDHPNTAVQCIPVENNLILSWKSFKVWKKWRKHFSPAVFPPAPGSWSRCAQVRGKRSTSGKRLRLEAHDPSFYMQALSVFRKLGKLWSLWSTNRRAIATKFPHCVWAKLETMIRDWTLSH